VCIFVRSTWRRRHELCSDVCYIVRASFDRFALGCWLTQGYDNSMIYIYTGTMNDLPSYAMMDDDLICYSYDILQHTALYCDLLQYRLYCLLLYLYASGIYIYIHIICPCFPFIDRFDSALSTCFGVLYWLGCACVPRETYWNLLLEVTEWHLAAS